MKHTLFSIMLVAVTGILAGCPTETTNLVVSLVWQDDGGRQFTEEARPFDIVDAPDGAVTHFDGGRFQSGSVKYKLSGFPDVIKQNLVVNDAKMSTLDHHLAGALIAVAGYVIPTVLCGDGYASNEFEVVIPMGQAVETAVLEVQTSVGQFVLTLRGAAYGGHSGEGEGEGQIEHYALTTSVSPAGAGTVTGAGTYDAGETVSVTATANSGYTFDHWTVNGSMGITNPAAQVTMNSDADVVAVFKATGTVTPVTGVAVVISWSGSNLNFAATGATPNGKIGLEMYFVDEYIKLPPFQARDVFTVNASGCASGTLSGFRTDAKILRFSVVTTETSGGYVPHESVAATYNGSAIPIVDDGFGHKALHVTVR